MNVVQTLIQIVINLFCFCFVTKNLKIFSGSSLLFRGLSFVFSLSSTQFFCSNEGKFRYRAAKIYVKLTKNLINFEFRTWTVIFRLPSRTTSLRTDPTFSLGLLLSQIMSIGTFSKSLKKFMAIFFSSET